MTTDAADTPAALPAQATTAGQLLRAAREAKGLHIAALAAALKVAPRKLELLEGDRHAELNDATFARVLAQAVCRHLKMDAAPVLALLPQPRNPGLGRVVEGGLNARFDTSHSGSASLMGGRHSSDAGSLQDLLRRPLVLAALLLLVAAPVVWFWPGLGSRSPGPAPSLAPQTAVGLAASSAASAASPEAAAPSEAAADAMPAQPSASGSVSTSTSVVQETVHSAPPAQLPGAATAASAPPGAAASAPLAPPPAADAALVISVIEASWVQVTDGGNQTVLSRTVLPGESVRLNAPSPLRLTVGNAVATRLQYKGQPVDLAPLTRDNVARLELK